MGGPLQGWNSELTGEGMVVADGTVEMSVVFPRLEVVYICWASRKLPSGGCAEAGRWAHRESWGIWIPFIGRAVCGLEYAPCRSGGLGKQHRKFRRAEAGSGHTE